MAQLGLAVALVLGGCTVDPTPGNSTTGTSEDDTTAGPSTGLDPVAQPSDCDALREQGACEALHGPDFECVWFPEAYAATLDGETCTVGDAIGWCLAAYTVGDTGCVDDFSYSCPDGGAASSLFVREAEDGTIVLIQDFVLTGVDFACGQPVLWEGCDGTEGPAACECGCDPGLPE